MGADLVVRFAGEGGQGQVTAAEGMAEAAARVGYHVQTFATYPSQIEGGPVWAQTRISTNPILTQGDQLDVLVALNRQAYENHIADLRDGGIVIYNSKDFDTALTGLKIKHTYVTRQGGHVWPVWRWSLSEFAPLLFHKG